MTALRVYIGYAAEDVSLFKELQNHLSAAGIIVLHRGEIPPGENEATFAAMILSTADLFVPLVSIEYLVSTAGKRELSSVHPPLVPVLARPCNLRGTPLEGLQPLPRSGKAVASTRDRAAAWLEVATEILRLTPNQTADSPGLRPEPLIDEIPAAPPVPPVAASLPPQGSTSARSRFSLSLRWGSLAITIAIAPILGIMCNHLHILNPTNFDYYDLGLPEDLAVQDLSMQENSITDLSAQDLARHKNRIARQKYDMSTISDMNTNEDMATVGDMVHADNITRINDVVTGKDMSATRVYLNIDTVREARSVSASKPKKISLIISPSNCINPADGRCSNSINNSRALDVILYQINQYVDPCRLRIEDFHHLYNGEFNRYFCRVRVESKSYAHPEFLLLNDTKYIIAVAIGRGAGKNSIRMIDAATVRQTGRLPTLFIYGYDICLGKPCLESQEVQCP